MALETYRNKRNFRKTSEPSGEKGRSGEKPIFVVQEHHASRLHYDFRLEADGVLKSWAVPKGVSMDPSDKRLAVQVEDHPLEYATFSGDIPAGEYGAGHVEIWDKGTYHNLMENKPKPLTLGESIEAGHVEVALSGKRLRGNFVMVRTRMGGRKANWLLMKMDDPFARPSDDPGGEKKPPAKSRSSRKKKTAAIRRPAGRSQEVEFTNLDKVMFPQAGITKGEVVHYYLGIADWILPYLKNRPVTLERLPDGIGGPRFWQKNTPKYYPDWIGRARIKTQEGKPVDYVLINDADALAYLVNQGTITFHINLSRVGQLDRPDFVLFDLDPGDAPFTHALKIARRIHAILNPRGLRAYVKTSGKTGLHVMVPWRQEGDFDAARAFAMTIAEQVVEDLPKLATTERTIRKRGDRVYVDVIQNAMGHHVVAPWTLRPTAGATVSTPLQWRELTAKLDPSAFTLQSIPARLVGRKTDDMARVLGG